MRRIVVKDLVEASQQTDVSTYGSADQASDPWSAFLANGGSSHLSLSWDGAASNFWSSALSAVELFNVSSTAFGEQWASSPVLSALPHFNAPGLGTATPALTSSADPIIGDVSGSDGAEAFSNRGGKSGSGSTS